MKRFPIIKKSIVGKNFEKNLHIKYPKQKEARGEARNNEEITNK